MRPDEVVEAVLSRTRITDVPTSFTCDDCGRHEPILLLVVTPDPWEHPDVPPNRLKAQCQKCGACARKGEQLELAL